MKAESLRIGNLVSYADQETLVLDILRTHVELGYFKDSIGFERRYDEFQPIPLTEEWLLKFGFEENQCYRKGSNRYCLYLGSVVVK